MSHQGRRREHAEPGTCRAWLGWARALGWTLPVLLLLALGAGAPGVAAAEDDAPADEGAPFAWVPRAEGLLVFGVSSVVPHPTDGDRVFAHVHGKGIAESRDRGETWRVLAAAPACTPDSSVCITLDAREPGVLYIVVDGRIHKSEDDGVTFRDITSGSLAAYTWDKRQTAYLANQVVIDAKKSNSLLVGTLGDGWHHGGLYQSLDGGKTWEAVAGSDVADSLLAADVPWVRRDPKTDKNIAAFGRTAIYHSEKSGTLFKRLPLGGKTVRPYDVRSVSLSPGGRDLYLCDPRGVWYSKDAGKAWSKDPVVEGDALAAEPDPHARRLFVVLGDRGLCVFDKGKTEPVGGPEAADPGYAGAEIREITPHPRDRKLVYASSPVSGLWRSEDDGLSFTHHIETVPQVTDRLSHVGVHPAGEHVHLAIGTTGRTYRSSDHGATWSHVGRVGTSVRHLVPGTEAGAWWAAGRHVFHSTDDGSTWTVALETPEEDDSVACVHVHPAGGVYALLRQTGRVAHAADGTTWSLPKVKDAPLDGTTPAVDFDVDPTNAQHLVMAATSPNERWLPADLSGGVYESWDGGATWTPIHATMQPRKSAPADAQRRAAWWNHAAFVRFDPCTGLVVYGAHRRGVLARRSLAPDLPAAERKGAFQSWVDVSPLEGVRPAPEAAIASVCYEPSSGKPEGEADPEVAASAATSRWVMQLVAGTGATTTLSITSADLLAAWETGRATATPLNKEEPPSAAVWTQETDPGVPMESLVADVAHPGRRLAVDGRGRRGVLIWERPGMTDVVEQPEEAPDDTGPVDPSAPVDPLAPAPGEPGAPPPVVPPVVPPTEPGAPVPGSPEPAPPAPGEPVPGDPTAPGTPAPDAPPPDAPPPEAPPPESPPPEAPPPESPPPDSPPPEEAPPEAPKDAPVPPPAPAGSGG